MSTDDPVEAGEPADRGEGLRWAIGRIAGIDPAMVDADEAARRLSLPDWTARRADLRERWSGDGLYPMTAFEMAGAVARDANEGECETCAHHDMDHIDRRGLLNLVSALLDQIAALDARPAPEAGNLRAALEGLIEAVENYSPRFDDDPTQDERLERATERARAALRESES